MNNHQIDSYQIDDEIESAGGPKEQKPGKKGNVLLALVEIMINPTQGWKKFRRRKYSLEQVANATFYPFTGLAALSCFMRMVYDGMQTVASTLIAALGIFMSFFFGNFVSQAFMKVLLPKDCRYVADTIFMKQMTMLMLTTLAFFFTLNSLLPMLNPILVFLPIWTVYVITKGVRFLQPPQEKRMTVATIVCVCIIGSPMLISWLFDMITPK